MGTKQLETRLARLESEFEQLKTSLKSCTEKGWRAVVGSHEGSSTFESVVREMRRLRRKDYQDAVADKADSQE